MVPIIVIGGGPAGMMAAGQAASCGRKVILLEKTGQLGNKLAISGKGRGNLTNFSDLHDFIGHFNRDGRFLHQPFSKFFIDDLIRFFEDLGVPLVRERGGRMYPQSGRAQDIVESLTGWLDQTGVEVRYNCGVEALVTNIGHLRGIRYHGRNVECDRAILACGGASYPATGSTGDGYRLAASCGHTIVSPRPALVPLTVGHAQIQTLAGLDLKNIGVRIYINGKRKVNDFGEISFNRTGLGGPVILTHSRLVVDSLATGKNVDISLDLKPALDERKLDNRLKRDFQQRASEPIHSVLRGLLPKTLIPFCLGDSSLESEKASGQINGEERLRLRKWLKDFRLKVDGHRPLAEAIVTAGGIKVSEIDPHTMESKLIKGLYFCGELLDVDADTGGYNLQAAFSTGWVAGRSAAAGKNSHIS